MNNLARKKNGFKYEKGKKSEIDEFIVKKYDLATFLNFVNILVSFQHFLQRFSVASIQLVSTE